MNLWNILKKIWNDPVWSKVIAVAAVFVVSSIYAYFKGWLPEGIEILKHALVTSTILPNWLIEGLILLASLQLATIILKIFSSSTKPMQVAIKQVIADAADLNVPVVTLLRKSKVIATKLGQTDFLEWINKELNGYKGIEAKDLPSYRQIYGEPKALNPYRGGWESVQFESAKMREILSYTPCGQNVGSLEEMLNTDESIVFSLSPKQKQMAIDLMKGCTDFHVVISGTSLHEILTAVRNSIHEWALKLDSA
ncbi:MAG: hypothetical protein V1721_02015 [Pseudomonadota bacterium]